MPVERSAGIILYRDTSEGRRYLVLRASRSESDITPTKNVKEFWDFTKGQLKPGEDGIGAARREAEEETGITNYDLVSDFKKTVQYFTRREGKPVPKFVAMFLARTSQEEVHLSWEHDQHEWLGFREAHERLSHPKMKEALAAAEDFFIRKSHAPSHIS